MITVQLPNEIQAFGKIITQVAWRVNYPDNLMYYQLQTVLGLSIKEGNWSVPNEIINIWGVDDSIISNALIQAQPWNN
jgi:hypothetical protein